MNELVPVQLDLNTYTLMLATGREGDQILEVMVTPTRSREEARRDFLTHFYPDEWGIQQRLARSVYIRPGVDHHALGRIFTEHFLLGLEQDGTLVGTFRMRSYEPAG
ncbi:hypothetical protein E7T06_09420 [Deinococcus sp. Arct2-2]|uniref:hypothetical protein n=1 Tax=Deinococcus sp. Arct2-2 TaxID=2568653 RepID=UPI0010A2DA80|nr:hypothetical protein [Deinococcus sp. Arct2-2]THF69967.1 hypothetical protein E7T06_09420 [Deinococcus sp. Arct2-2]